MIPNTRVPNRFVLNCTPILDPAAVDSVCFRFPSTVLLNGIPAKFVGMPLPTVLERQTWAYSMKPVGVTEMAPSRTVVGPCGGTSPTAAAGGGGDGPGDPVGARSGVCG